MAYQEYSINVDTFIHQNKKDSEINQKSHIHIS